VRPFVGGQLVCGFAASRAESLWLSVRYLEEGEASPRRLSRQSSRGMTESQRLAAREAAKPQIKSVPQPVSVWLLTTSIQSTNRCGSANGQVSDFHRARCNECVAPQSDM